MELKQGMVVSGTVEGYSSEGLGIVRIGGRVVFVSRAIRGEELEIRITRVMKAAAAGEIVKIRKASPERVAPECPLFGQCGGCDFQHMTYPEELRAKRQRVQDAFHHLGGLDLEVEEILGAKSPLHYRNKGQYPVGADGTIGFYRARSHEVVPVRSCLIQSETSDAIALAVGEWMRRYKIRGYDETNGKGMIRHVYVRVNRKGESLTCVIANAKQLPREPELCGYIRTVAPKNVGVVLNTNTARSNVILGKKYRLLEGRDYLTDTLCGLSFKLSVPSFYQVNRDQAEVLYGKALEYAGLTGEETVLDLYCGIGTITLYLAQHARRVIGAEIVPAAIRDAEENAERNDIRNVSFICGDSSAVAERMRDEGLHPDVVTVDPPRKGLSDGIIRSICAMNPPKVVYVSCNPATLARDLVYFASFGYVATRSAAVDMFPASAHVETVVLMSKVKE